MPIAASMNNANEEGSGTAEIDNVPLASRPDVSHANPWSRGGRLTRSNPTPLVELKSRMSKKDQRL